VTSLLEILNVCGASCRQTKEELLIDPRPMSSRPVGAERMKKTRASVGMLGSMLARFGKAEIAYPGGCVIGSRPIDLHLAALEQMGVTFEEKNDTITGIHHTLHGAEIRLRAASVGATQNIMMAAATAQGITTIKNAAREPEVVCLGRFLNEMGAKIKGLGSPHVQIEGVHSLHGGTFEIPPDRIVAGTYLLAACASGGKLLLEHAQAEELADPIDKMRQMGADILCRGTQIFIDASEPLHKLPYVCTEGYPGFPTDLQSALLSTYCMASGDGTIEEQIFENRFQTAYELRRMGAEIEISGQKAFLKGRQPLEGCLVHAADLRCGSALLIAAVCAKGQTVIEQADCIGRGYEDIVRDFRAMGCHCTWEEE
jgi:UDP-N-acetylglucosamine 1-carboxyvinyltransferase